MSEQVELGQVIERPAQVELGQVVDTTAAQATPAAKPETISARIGKDIITAMKAHDEHRLTTLRMVKSSLKNREIEKREPLTDVEEQAILSTLIKQRKESIESFTKGNRPELAEKEALEVKIIEVYLPTAASDEEVRTIILGALNHLAADAGGVRPGPKDLGPALRVIKQRLLASGIRADGKVVSDILKEELGASRVG